MWHAELVGVVRAYPPTKEKFDALLKVRRANIERLKAEGRWTRGGVRNGESRHARQIDRADTRKAHTLQIAAAQVLKREKIKSRNEAIARAPEIVKQMMAENMINAKLLTDIEKGNVALEFATSVIVDEHMSIKDRLAAVKIVVDFTKARPATKSEVQFKNSEEFLAALLKE